MTMQEIIELLDKYWRFDEYQQPMSSWHDKQDLIELLNKQKLNKLPVMRPASASGEGRTVASEGEEKHVSDGLCHCVKHYDCDCIYENKCSECGLPLRA